MTGEEKGMQRKGRGEVEGVHVWELIEERDKKAKGREGSEGNKLKEGKGSKVRGVGIQGGYSGFQVTGLIK